MHSRNANSLMPWLLTAPRGWAGELGKLRAKGGIAGNVWRSWTSVQTKFDMHALQNHQSSFQGLRAKPNWNLRLNLSFAPMRLTTCDGFELLLLFCVSRRSHHLFLRPLKLRRCWRELARRVRWCLDAQSPHDASDDGQS